jgi:hypothetical protein
VQKAILVIISIGTVTMILYLINSILGIPEIGKLLLKLKVARDLRTATCDLVSEETLERVPQLNKKFPKKLSRDLLTRI